MHSQSPIPKVFVSAAAEQNDAERVDPFSVDIRVGASARVEADRRKGAVVRLLACWLKGCTTRKSPLDEQTMCAASEGKA